MSGGMYILFLVCKTFDLHVSNSLNIILSWQHTFQLKNPNSYLPKGAIQKRECENLSKILGDAAPSSCSMYRHGIEDSFSVPSEGDVFKGEDAEKHRQSWLCKWLFNSILTINNAN